MVGIIFLQPFLTGRTMALEFLFKSADQVFFGVHRLMRVQKLLLHSPEDKNQKSEVSKNKYL